MAPIMDYGDYWDCTYSMQAKPVDCLLPTGIIIILPVERDATIAEIKSVRITEGILSL